MQQEVLKRQQQYESLKPVGMSPLAPREGHYLVLNTSVMKIAGVDCKIARGLWKPTASDEFYPDHPVTIQIKSLEGVHGIGPKHKLNKTIIKSIIHIMKAQVLTIGQERVFSVEWDIFNNPSSYSSGSLDDSDEELLLMESIEASTVEDVELTQAINCQLSQDDEVMHAILMMEDNAYDDYEQTNDWILSLQAQDLPTNNQIPNL